ncbi:MAG: GyrI-like domain-containing protein, partial [Verrucomicrobiales bacterium]
SIFSDPGSGQGVEVTWTMESSLPFFLFFLTRMMSAMIGRDYERGLAMLKDFVETGSVPSKLEFPGRKSFPGFRFVGTRVSAQIADIGPSMEATFGKLETWLKESGTIPVGPPFSMVHKWDLVQGVTEYTAGFPVDQETGAGNLPEGLLFGSIPACETEIVRHTGPYRHLANAWSAVMARAKGFKWRTNRAVDPFEVYENRKGEVPDEKLVTVIHLPVKS